MTDTVEDMKRIQDVLRRHPKPDLVINRCMGDTADRFKALAERDFGNDYGAALKWLMDMYIPQNLAILEKLDEIEYRLNVLEKGPEESGKSIKFLDGNVKKVR